MELKISWVSTSVVRVSASGSGKSALSTAAAPKASAKTATSPWVADSPKETETLSSPMVRTRYPAFSKLNLIDAASTPATEKAGYLVRTIGEDKVSVKELRGSNLQTLSSNCTGKGSSQGVHVVSNLLQAFWTVVDGVHGSHVGQKCLRGTNI